MFDHFVDMRMCSNLLKKFLTEKFIFCAVQPIESYLFIYLLTCEKGAIINSVIENILVKILIYSLTKSKP